MEQFKLLNKPNYNVKIESRSVIIKPITDFEVNENYISWLNNEDINEYLEVRHKSQTKDSVIEYINTLRKSEGLEMFAIFNNKTMSHIGNLTITSFNKNNSGVVDFGLMIGDSFSRERGVGGECHVAFLEFIFSLSRVTRINANVASENKSALRTLKSVGYIEEGIRRKCFPLRSGKNCDIVYFGILRDEWEERKKKLQLFLNSIKIVILN
jgi:RimJ/RimL family protein N-acetyltransferase